MKPLLKFILLTMLSVLSMQVAGQPASKPTAFTWTGTWHFTRTSAADGVTALDIKIGKNVQLPNSRAYLNSIYQVRNRFPASSAWTTLAVGDLSKLIPEGNALNEDKQEAYLDEMDKANVKVFIEFFPFKNEDVCLSIEKWLNKYKGHRCIMGAGIELEYYGKATDSLTKAWDDQVKSVNPGYRLFLRHYDPSFIPENYRGKGDLIFIDDASEGLRGDLNKGFADWARRFAPTACAFQIGYPADEDGMNGSNALGWWLLKDPIREWGNELLALIKNDRQQLGLIWVTVRSGKSYHRKWDLTRDVKPPAGNAGLK